MGGGGRREAQEGGGICKYLWLIHIVVWQKSTQHCKANIFQSKKEASIDISTVSMLRKPRSRMQGNLSQIALLSEKNYPSSLHLRIGFL